MVVEEFELRGRNRRLTHLPVVGCIHAHRHAVHAQQNERQEKEETITERQPLLDNECGDVKASGSDG
jgi:hypothetical protein